LDGARATIMQLHSVQSHKRPALHCAFLKMCDKLSGQ